MYLNSTGAIIEAPCWAHTRRYWYEAHQKDSVRAHHVLAVIRRLPQ
ncbi:MAG: transposase [Planctomycetaceae bacterium]|nr:transposase [Planctomycetaceae bacterium]